MSQMFSTFSSTARCSHAGNKTPNLFSAPVSPAGNPLLVFSSLLYWGEEGRYSPERVMAELLASQSVTDKDIVHNEMETVVIDKKLVRLAVSAVVKTWARRSSRTIVLGNMRGRNIRSSKVNVIEQVLKGVRSKSAVIGTRKLKVGDSLGECGKEVSRNLFTGLSRTYISPSSTTTPHTLDQYQLPKDLVHVLPPVSNERKQYRIQVPAAQDKCDFCGRNFSNLNNLRRHKQSGGCTGDTVGTPRIGQVEGGRRRLQLEEGEMAVLVWEPVDMILPD